MKLYEIDERLDSLVDPETGELLDYEAFEALSIERDAKIENLCLWYKNLCDDAKSLREEIAKLTERKQRAERKAERLRKYVEFALRGERFNTVLCSVYYHKSKALDVTDVHAAAEWLDEHGHHDLVAYGEPKLDKRSVTELVKQGEKVPGVKLVENVSTVVR